MIRLLQIMLTGCFVLINIGCFSQDSLYVFQPITIHPSSNNSLMIRNEELGTNLFRGSPDIKIPIYAIDVDGFNIPIYMQYNSTGMKVDDQSGTFGLGWDLVAGGKVSRTIKNKRDEIGDFNSMRRGFIKGTGTSVQNTAIALGNVPVSPRNTHNIVGAAFEIDHRDLLPDIFIYNGPGIGGKFVIDHNGVPFGIPKQNHKIKHPFFGEVNGYMSIINENGIRYTYANLEYAQTEKKVYYLGTQSSYLEFLKDPDNPGYSESTGRQRDWQDTEQYTSAWNLRTITDMNHQVLANFNYISGANTERSYNETLDTERHPSPNHHVAYTKTEFDLKFLSQISTRNIQVQFEYVNETSASTNKLLDKIIIKDLAGQEKLTFDFHYLFVDVGPVDLSSQRIFLREIKLNNEDYYKFHYYNEATFNLLNFENSPYVDAWGHFKNNDDPLNSKLPLAITESGETIGGGMLKSSPDFISTRMGALSNIINPLGGKTEYIYELNEIGGVSHGGLRVKEVVKKDASNNQISKREFLYQYDQNGNSSGIPASNITPSSTYDFDLYDPYIHITSNPWNRVISNQLKLYSEPKSSHFEVNSSVSYDEVIELIDGNGKIVRNFYSLEDEFDTPSEVITMINTQDDDKYDLLLQSRIPMKGAVNNPTFKWGGVQNEKTFNETGTLLKEHRMTYIDLASSTTFYGLMYDKVSMPLDGWGIERIEQYSLVPFTNYYYKNRLNHAIFYDHSGNGSILKSEESYFSYSAQGLLSRRDVYDSNRDLIEKFSYLYPTDINWTDLEESPIPGGATSDELRALWVMKGKNILSSPIEIVHYNSEQNRIKRAQYLSYSTIYEDLEGGLYLDLEEIDNYHVFPDQLYEFENSELDQAIAQIRVDRGGTEQVILTDDRYISKRKYNYGKSFDNYKLQNIKTEDGIENKYTYQSSGKLATQTINKWDDDSFIITDSFEDSNYSQFWDRTLVAISNEAFSGKHAAHIQGIQESFRLEPDDGLNYQVSFCYKNLSAGAEIEIMGQPINAAEKTSIRNGWTLVNKTLEIPTNGNIDFYLEVDDALIDNFILAPVTSGVEIYTHDDVYGATSISDQNGLTTFFEYDSNGRLIRKRNTQGHIIQEAEYNTKGN